MDLTSADYEFQLGALLPPGPAWPRDDGALLTKMLSAWAVEFARVHGRSSSLMAEADPRLSVELFMDWERVAGLPDSCVAAFGDEQTADQRRAALVGKIAGQGGASRAYFIGLASAMGYTITITEFKAHDVDDDVDAPIYGTAWNFAWQINAASDTVTCIEVDSGVDEPLAAWGNALLECVINRLKPAHTTLIFSYS